MHDKRIAGPELLPERNVKDDGLAGGFTTGSSPLRLRRKAERFGE